MGRAAEEMFKRMRLRIVAAVFVAIGGLVPIIAASDPAAAEPRTYTYTVKSTDGNAKGVFTVQWYSTTRAYFTADAYDLKADGRGAIAQVRAQNLYQPDSRDGELFLNIHVTRGAGWDTLQDYSYNRTVDLAALRFEVCNGYSGSTPQRCDFVQARNVTEQPATVAKTPQVRR